MESEFNITKVNENTDGSFDYGIFQINSHYWCNDYRSHTENICQVECEGLAGAPWVARNQGIPLLNRGSDSCPNHHRRLCGVLAVPRKALQSVAAEQ